MFISSVAAISVCSQSALVNHTHSLVWYCRPWVISLSQRRLTVIQTSGLDKINSLDSRSDMIPYLCFWHKYREKANDCALSRYSFYSLNVSQRWCI